MKKIIYTSLLVVLAVFGAQAQQDPHYTQYMYNMNVINPAYAGSKEHLSFGLLYRKQWVDIEGAPSTFSAAGSMPVGKNVGLGLSMISDKIGPISENNVYADFSYTLNLGGEHRLAFGLKGGATFHKVGLYSEIGQDNVPDLNDPAFAKNTSNTFLNIGSGLFYYTDNYYLAFSVPNMIKSTHLDYDGRKYGNESVHYFLTGGYVFQLSDLWKFKPFAMIKTAFGSPMSYDISTNFLYNERFEMGATYRRDDSFGAMVNYAISPNVRVGYAYDHVISDLKVATTSSHEVILLFDLNFPKKVSQSPRYF
ncbi:type IX secretion system membrane protein PorP/SprF [Flavobacterium sp. CYK-55]|uniref:PorP/SprF family type IX secretion system membrane protein n=1 Tax=Flavobacterium sp. CYK-55 TaxID=2835529 RepID=UPI001BCDC368|nr:type IX secretion system membrane protein PorP/SprF [Flavobacterium sp. CYK-55]MBS7786113.1 type IX secretion system membrane protein PorP/SprF [Flavobacterium sp. CYK-55]